MCTEPVLQHVCRCLHHLVSVYEESWRFVCSRRFSVQRCARCHLGISASEMVMRARDSVYHLSCFTCTTCNKTLTTGDHFGMKDSLVYCRLHFETLVQGPDYHPQLNFAELAAKGGGLTLPYFNGTGTAQKGRPRKRKSPAMGIDIPSYNTGETACCSGPHVKSGTYKYMCIRKYL